MSPLVAAWGQAVKRCGFAAVVLLAALAALPLPAGAQGDAQSCPAGTDPLTLKPGQWVWTPEVAPEGPLVIIISLPQQRAYVFRNGIQIGVSATSTGRPGYETPTGVFRVLEKDIDHKSNLYDDAPMPYMLRLTWGGVALHAGRDPGAPASHGCIRLPLEFAKSLYSNVPLGSLVIVTDRAIEAGLRVAPEMMAPPPTDLAPDPGELWWPECGAGGSVSIVVSGRDKLLSVMRGGVEIGRTPINIAGDEPLHTHALVLLDPAHSKATAAPRSGNWLLVDLPGDAALPPERKHSHDIDRIRMPPMFAAKLATVLKPGATMLISDLPLEVGGLAELRVFGESE